MSPLFYLEDIEENERYIPKETIVIGLEIMPGENMQK